MIVYRSTAPSVIGVKAFWFTRLVVSGDALSMAVRPRDVVDATGGWLAVGARRRRFPVAAAGPADAAAGAWIAEPSVYNRAAQSILVRTYVGVADPALRQWRIDHPGLVAAATDRDVVCGHLLGYAAGRANGYLYGDAADGDLELTEPAGRERALTALAAIVR
jgi:hypothetical protein